MNHSAFCSVASILVVFTGVFGEGPDKKGPSQKATPAAAKVITNSIGMKLTLIPAGEFMMGSCESAADTVAFFKRVYGSSPPDGIPPQLYPHFFKNEHPQHQVRITRPFYLGTYHVTRGQFRQFVADTGYRTDAEQGESPGALGWDSEKGRFDYSEKYSWRNVGFEQADDHPVVNVSWNDAMAFCNWLSAKEEKTYRLPTEAEWEYACRAGTTTRYYNGDDPESLAEVGNIDDAAKRAKFPDWEAVLPQRGPPSVVPPRPRHPRGGQGGAPRKVPELKVTIKANDGYVFTAPVGKFRPNAFGLYDMHGNVWQWCADRYGAKYYATSPTDDPAGPDSGGARVFRGGSWGVGADYARSAKRGDLSPRNGDITRGFRIAKTN